MTERYFFELLPYRHNRTEVIYTICDRRQGISFPLATCEDAIVAQKIVDALNARNTPITLDSHTDLMVSRPC